MRDDDKQKRRRVLPMLALLLFVMYPLSTGPVYWLGSTLFSDSSTFYVVAGIFYLPITLLSLIFPSFQEVWFWYLELGTPDTPPPP